MDNISRELISVIVPVYKVEAYLDRCVQSIVDQTYTNLEIILVDDGSPDRCPQMCDDWAKKDPRIRVVHKKNGGLSNARNAGFAVASGELISYIDSDDWIEPAFFEVLYETMTKNGCDIASCKYRKAYADEPLPPSKHEYTCRVLERFDAMAGLLDGSTYQIVCNKLYRRATIDGILFEVGKYHEDEFWTYRVIGNCKKVAATDYVGLNYFQRSTSIMGEDFSLKRLDATEAHLRRLLYLNKEFPILAQKAALKLRFLCLWHGQLSLSMLSKSEKKSALRFLKKVVRSAPLSRSHTKAMPITHKLWLWSSWYCFSLVCRLRNALKIGL